MDAVAVVEVMDAADVMEGGDGGGGYGAAGLGFGQAVGGDFVDYLELREAIIFPAESAHSL